MKQIPALLTALLLAGFLAACEPIPGPPDPGPSSGAAPVSSLPPASAPSASAPGLAECAELYGRELLGGEEQAAYDLLRAAAQAGDTEVALPALGADGLFRVMTYLRRDNPKLDWLEHEYSFEQREDSTWVRLRYSLAPAGIAAENDRLEGAADSLLGGLSNELSEFDRAVLIHDRLVESIVYDLDAPRKSELAGALLDGRATCEGYAKAYQYLLQKAGLQALLVYGEAGEAHAWNIVRLDGDYYLCDVTWDDVPLADGGEFLSHEYLFWDDASFAVSHTPTGSESTNLPLPVCDSLEQNYFRKTGTLLESPDPQEAEAAFQRALDRAAAYGCTAVQVGFSTPLLADVIEAGLNGDGALDRFLKEAAARKGFDVIGRAFSDARTSLTYLVKPAA